ncbi:uncharacterized protein N7483_009418 [Penicillium malachiteum]|uniref:uncharacterized protein n=1 Tax=Penicillium malachiteum TaxID=1324776 RepID=UPI0025488431|nr:uncharacterized protein N7483_009418 [Penicillium malachiteum]KAJ5721484.1 hypothetical protein N7483_009418 [Penicillium malachiteum]
MDDYSEKSADVGYLLIEYIEQSRGAMLSTSWNDCRNDMRLRTNFMRDLARILLKMSSIPLPCNGYFTIDRSGDLALNNRPLTMQLQILENENIPASLPQEYTYSTVDSYITDLLSTHDSRLQNQPNAVNNIGDCSNQMSALTAMRAIAPLFYDQDQRRGPFVFTLTDLHQSNNLVGQDWHITVSTRSGMGLLPADANDRTSILVNKQSRRYG